MPRQFQIRGALADQRFAPLAAVEQWAGRSTPVVLARPEADAVAPLAELNREGVVVEMGRVTLAGTEYGIYPWVEGLDLHQIRELGPLTSQQITHLDTEIRRILTDLPVPHGRINGGAVRVRGDGSVSLVDWRGEGDDEAALRGLLEEMGGDVEADSGLTWAERLGQHSAELRPHLLTGSVLTEGASGEEMPARVRTALFAGFTTILGFLAGWTLRP